MLNQDALAQLRQLKQTIHDGKDRAEGVVKGSQGRFGFVALDDGREIYLPPEQMQRVFPDDRIAIEVITGAEGKPIAQLERLIESPLLSFTGRYVVRDNAHFVEPDLPRLSRWIFVPPKLRRPAQAKPNHQTAAGEQQSQPKHGDWVRARITQHPFNDGKPQARIDAIIGSENQKNIEVRYTLARFDLADSAPALIEGDLAQPDAQTYEDFTALPFITIDGTETRDMDDALYAESLLPDAEANGAARWKLTVAIADPSAWIKPDSKLEQIIAARGTSAYLPGFSVPMLPEQLANDRCSLIPDVERFALVCEIWIDDSGHIIRYEFCQARVRSHAKLNYDQATEFLRVPQTSETPSWANSLRALNDIGQHLQQQRKRDHILLPERAEYRAQLDANGKVTGYQRQIKNAAHQLVEECMVATNRCAAHYLQQDGSDSGNAIFVCHAGFRSDRHDNVNKLIAAELPALADKNIADLSDYIALMQSIANTTTELPLREILTRAFERSQFSAKAAPHFGMGLPCYITITSPIRKFNDYLSHRAIKAKLRGEKSAPFAPEMIAQLQNCSDRARQAANFAQQWLDCGYIQKQIDEAQANPSTYQATIVHVTSSGFLVRLNDNGIQGFIDTRHTGEKFSFDSIYMRLSSATKSYLLDQQVEVKVASIDVKKRQIAFTLAAPASIPA